MHSARSLSGRDECGIFDIIIYLRFMYCSLIQRLIWNFFLVNFLFQIIYKLDDGGFDGNW